MNDARRTTPPSFSPPDSGPDALPRRRLLQGVVALPIGRRLVAAGIPAGAMSPPLLAATPSCGAGSQATPRQTEGPYFTRDSPQRQSLVEQGMSGTRLVLVGRVLAPDCMPLPGALLDFWQADAAGDYDNRGYRLRGHQFTDAEGRYRLETVVPGLYPGRTRHIHVKVQPKGGPVLTTQIYFPDVPQNRRDGLFSPALLVSLNEAGAAPLDASPRPEPAAAVQASFEFVVATA